MPVTAKLSRRFYERFGDELTNELVDWFNAVDATYRSDLRDLNENNFARFDAKLEQRVAVVEARVAAVEVRLCHRLDGVDANIAHQLESLGDRLDKQFSDFETRMLRWTVGLWTATILTITGFGFA